MTEPQILASLSADERSRLLALAEVEIQKNAAVVTVIAEHQGTEIRIARKVAKCDRHGVFQFLVFAAEPHPLLVCPSCMGSPASNLPKAALIEKFASRLLKARTDKQMTQGELAYQIGAHMTRSRVNNWEKRRYMPHPTEFPKLAEVLGVKAAWLAGWED